jgi:peptidoglycan hydrolase-like protein with peptidoglycan-binding domain
MPRHAVLRLLAAMMMGLTLAAGVVVADAVRSPATAEARCTISVTLRVGSTGVAVRCLQARLNALGYTAGPVDGSFGPMTRAAVVRFQRAEGLPVDGIVGRRTARARRIWRPSPAPAGTPARADDRGRRPAREARRRLALPSRRHVRAGRPQRGAPVAPTPVR